MMNVIVNGKTYKGKTYKVIEDAADNIETTMVDGNTIEFVSGIGEDTDGNRYEIDWYLDYDSDKLPEDAENWVSDWNTADEAHLIEN